MAGYPHSSRGHGNTGGYHPNLLQSRKESSARHSDTLRRMAIRNSYETRSLGGTCALRVSTTPTATHLLPPINKTPANTQRGGQKGQRSVSPTSLRCIQGRPRSTSDQLQVFGVNKDSQGTMKRSSSQNSVAVNRVTPTIQTGSSSYVYHTPSGRKIGATKSRQAYEKVRIPAPQELQLDMKRSSSCSTVAAHSTGLKAASEEKALLHSSPTSNCSDNLPGSYSYHGSNWTHRNGGQAVYPEHITDGIKTKEVWNTSTANMHIMRLKSPQAFKHIAHTNLPSGQLVPPDPTETHHPSHVQLRVDSNYRSSFQCPQSLPQYDRSLPITRFGSTPVALPATGIAVPHLISPRSPSAAQAKAIRVKLHTPRGKKVASLV